MKRKTFYGLVAGVGLASTISGATMNYIEKNNDKNTLLPEILYGVGAFGILGGSANWSYELSANSNREEGIKKGLERDLEDKYDPDRSIRK